MFEENRWRLAPTVCLILLATLVTGPLLADEMRRVHVVKGHEGEGVHKIHVECDGEDCESRRAIFIGEDGELGELGEDFTWIMGDGHGMHWVGADGTYLGVQLTELTNELRAHFGVPADQGVLVAKVQEESPAARAGVRVGDVITAVDGEIVTTGGELAGKIRRRAAGETVALELFRDGAVERLSPTLAERESRIGSLGGGPHHLMRRVEVRCNDEDGEKDCEVTVGDGDLSGFDCGGEGECRVRMECNDGDCDCTANGEPVDCDSLPGHQLHHGE